MLEPSVSAELEPSTPRAATAPTSTGRQLAQTGADLVLLGEEFFASLYLLTLVLIVVGSALSICFALVASSASVPLTLLIALTATVGAAIGGRRLRQSYVWFRGDLAHRLLPIAFASFIVLVNGPNSPSWWIALPLLWLVAAVGTTSLALGGAVITGVAYLVGTSLGGEALVRGSDAEILAAAVGLPANVLVGRLIAVVFARFILSLHEIQETGLPSRFLGVQPGQPAGRHESSERPTSARPPRHLLPRPALGRRDKATGLSPREFEAAALLSDGRQYQEIASAMGIRTREVERLLESARSHVGARNNNHLAAIMIKRHYLP